MSGTLRRTFLRQGLGGTVGALVGGIDATAAPRTQSGAPDWNALRAEFLVPPDHAYLNTATLGTPPQSAINEVARCYRLLAADPEPRRAELYGRVDQSVRPLLARLVGADPAEIALTTSAGESLFIATNGIPLERGDEVIYTNLDHPAGIEPWTIRAANERLVLRQVELPSPFTTPAQVIEPIERACSPRTRVVAFCHVTRGGFLFPVKELCALARRRNVLTLVDGAQALGMMHVDLNDLGCDLYAASPHKWLLAPSGNGMLYVRRDVQERMRSLFAPVGKPVSGARRLEPVGTYALPVRVAMGSSLELFDRIGIPNIEARNRGLSDDLKAKLDQVPRVRRVTPMSRDVSSAGITLFEVASLKAEDLQARLIRKYRLHVDEHARNGLEAVRVSTHMYNSRDEVDRLIDAVREESRGS